MLAREPCGGREPCWGFPRRALQGTCRQPFSLNYSRPKELNRKKILRLTHLVRPPNRMNHPPGVHLPAAVSVLIGNGSTEWCFAQGRARNNPGRAARRNALRIHYWSHFFVRFTIGVLCLTGAPLEPLTPSPPNLSSPQILRARTSLVSTPDPNLV